MENQNQQHDIFFIRHGESTKNEAAHKYREERNMPFDWDLFVQDPQFLRTVIYNPTHIDCHLSQKGKKQCLAAREKLKDLNPDLILVSPLQRALQTCSLIFPNTKVPLIVEPLLSQTFRHSSQICRSIEIKKKQFPQFDFSPVEAEGQFWFIKNDSLQNQARYFELIKTLQSDYYHQKARSIMEFMESQNMGEKPENIRLRANKIKDKLKEYRKKYNRIAIVSHFFTIRYLVCEEFQENGEPKCGLVMPNCACHSTSLNQITQYG